MTQLPAPTPSEPAPVANGTEAAAPVAASHPEKRESHYRSGVTSLALSLGRPFGVKVFLNRPIITLSLSP